MIYCIAVILQIAPVSENLHFAVHPIALCKKIPWHLSTHTVHTYERKQCRCSFACAGVDHNYYFSPLLVQFSQYWSAAPVISIAGNANHAAQFCTISHNFAQSGPISFLTFAPHCKVVRNYFNVDLNRPEMSISGNMQSQFDNPSQKILISSGAGVISIAGGAEEKQQSLLYWIILNFALSIIMIYEICTDHICS